MIGKKTTREELASNDWKEKGPFGQFRLFEKACTEIGWNPETGIVELQRKKS